MTIQTLTLASHDEGRVRYELDYDDLTMTAVALRCLSRASKDARAWLVREADGETLTLRSAGRLDSARALPQDEAGRLPVVIDRQGRLRGGCAVVYAYPGE